MRTDEVTDNNTRKKGDIVITAIDLLVVLCPVFISVAVESEGIYTVIMAPFWIFDITPSYTGFRFEPGFVLPVLFFDIPKMLFVYWMHRYYSGKTTRTRTILIGFIGEMFPSILSIPSLIVVFNSLSILNQHFYIPVPILLVVGLVVTRHVPAPDIYTPWEGFYESPDWWDAETKTSRR